LKNSVGTAFKKFKWLKGGLLVAKKWVISSQKVGC